MPDPTKTCPRCQGLRYVPAMPAEPAMNDYTRAPNGGPRELLIGRMVPCPTCNRRGTVTLMSADRADG